jgi:hypothetical protein
MSKAPTSVRKSAPISRYGESGGFDCNRRTPKRLAKVCPWLARNNSWGFVCSRLVGAGYVRRVPYPSLATLLRSDAMAPSSEARLLILVW